MQLWVTPEQVIAALAGMLLCAGIGACGGTGTTTRPTGRSAEAGHTASVGSHRLENDLDDDGDATSENTGVYDADADLDNDPKTLAHSGYHDPDDSSVESFGHTPSAPETRLLQGLAARYYAAAAKADGRAACAMMAASLARSIPEDYGYRGPGPAYLRKARTCPAVMSGLFAHEHAILAGGAEVTGVRVAGDKAIALVGSPKFPAGYLQLVRVGHTWKVQGLLAQALP